LILLSLSSGAARATDAASHRHRVGAWARAGVLGGTSRAGLHAEGAFRLGERFGIHGTIGLEGWWIDLAGQLEHTDPYVVGGPSLRLGVGGALAPLPADSPTQLYIALGIGFAAERMAQQDRDDLSSMEADTSPSPDPAGWYHFVPYASASLDLPLTGALALVAGYEFAVYRQAAPMSTTLPVDQPEGGPVYTPHLTSFRHTWRVGISIHAIGPVGFSVGVSPILGHAVVDATEAPQLGVGDGDGPVALSADGGIAFLVGGWFRF